MKEISFSGLLLLEDSDPEFSFKRKGVSLSDERL